MKNVRQHLLDYITDVERCATAGAITVAGTGRLAQYTETLHQLGQQVPVLQEIATLNAALTQSHEREAAWHLLSLVTKTRPLRIALTALADSSATLMDIAESGPWQTDTPLNELFEELQTVRRSVSVRESLKDGKRQTSTDLRLINEWLNDALINNPPSPVDLSSDVLLPAYGPDIAAEFNDERFQATEITQARRIVALCRVAPTEGRAMLLREHPELAEFLGEDETPSTTE